LESVGVYTKQQRIAELGKRMPETSFTSLAYYIDLEWMYEAYRRTRKDGSAGVDNVTATEYEKDLDGNLRRLLEQFKSGSYVAPPVKRVYIPKGDGRVRPIGIPTVASYCTSYLYSLGMLRALFFDLGGVLDPLPQFSFLTGAQGNPVRGCGV
jgi:hypothetical protein